MHRMLFAALASCAGVALMAVASQSAVATVVLVDPTNMGDWSFDSRNPSGNLAVVPGSNGSMVYGPATPPIGVGSANLALPNGSGDSAEELRNTGYAGTLLSSLTSLSFSTYDTSNNGQQLPYLSIQINLEGTSTTPDDIIFFEPPYQQTSTGNPSLPDQNDPPGAVLNTWQTWDALDGGWWDNNGNCNPGTSVESLSACLAADPNATIENATTGLGGIRLGVGFADPNFPYNGYVDNFTIGTAAGTTTYNFDPNPVREPGTLALLGTGLLGLAAVCRRRRDG